MNGKTEQQRSLRGGSPERRPDCGTCSAHHIPASALCLFGDGSMVCTITGASITRAGKSLVKTSMGLKVIFVFLAIPHKRNVYLLHTYPFKAFRTCILPCIVLLLKVDPSAQGWYKWVTCTICEKNTLHET